ncbi:MAG: DUF1684 domain-containing protein [Actinomycetia bacterium]|nr:DUF1684 domain-containing protein [Actinomycetes bacterium]
MEARALENHRRKRDEFFKSHFASPVPEDDIESFSGLSYFAPNAEMTFEGRFESSDGSMVQIESTAGTSSGYHKIGTLSVTVLGTEYRFTVLDDGDGNPFIPFGDETNGESTYGGGRYLPVAFHDDGSAVIDFDLAHNPFCVYDDEFVCPLPPIENRISAPIEAGEKMYRTDV